MSDEEGYWGLNMKFSNEKVIQGDFWQFLGIFLVLGLYM